MSIRTKYIQCLAVFIISLLYPVYSQAQLTKFVFTPQWLPQAQFAGYYVALEKGYYKEAGLDVEIVYTSVNVQPTAMLANGKADIISLSLATALSAKNQGLDLVNIGQISQHSALQFVVKKSKGITQLSQLKGKKIGIWKSGFDEVPKALMAEKGIQVEWVPLLSTVNLFLIDGIDAMTVMSYNEYDQIVNRGINEDELQCFPMAAYGYDIPEDGLYCLKSTSQSKTQALKKFRQASLRGWEYAAKNKEYTLELVLKRMNEARVPANKAHQAWMLDKMLELINPGAKGIKAGELKESDFVKAVNIVNLHDEIKAKYTFNDFYPPMMR